MWSTTGLLLCMITSNRVFSSIWPTSYCAPERCLRQCYQVEQLHKSILGSWCAGNVLLIGDINKDGKCDVICTRLSVTRMSMMYRTNTGFGGGGLATRSQNFCGLPSDVYHPIVTDIDNDGYDDIICIFDDVPNDNEVRVSYIQGQAQYLPIPVSHTVVNATISSSRFSESNNTFTNKDLFKRSDNCTKYQSQCNHVQYQFPAAAVIPWYPWCLEWPGTFFSGDLNGDGYCDVICHSHVDNGIYIMYYIADIGRFVPPMKSIRIDGALEPAQFCNHDTEVVMVRDLNRDGRADIVCLVKSEQPNQVRVMFGEETTGLITSSPLSPFQVARFDVDSAASFDPVVACKGCSDTMPSIENGHVSYKNVIKQYEVICDFDYQARGNTQFNPCQSDPNLPNYGRFVQSLPVCKAATATLVFKVFGGKKLNPQFNENYFAIDSFDPIEVVDIDQINDCLWLCVKNLRCLSAEYQNKECRLYDFESAKKLLSDTFDGTSAILF